MLKTLNKDLKNYGDTIQTILDQKFKLETPKFVINSFKKYLHLKLGMLARKRRLQGIER